MGRLLFFVGRCNIVSSCNGMVISIPTELSIVPKMKQSAVSTRQNCIILMSA